MNPFDLVSATHLKHRYSGRIGLRLSDARPLWDTQRFQLNKKGAAAMEIGVDVVGQSYFLVPMGI